MFNTGGFLMQLSEKLDAYREREKEISDLEYQLSSLIADHKERTRKDFGFADGDVLNLEKLVEFFEKIKS